MSSRRSHINVFPATRSILSTAALAEQLLPDYDIAGPVECTLLGFGLNDTYLVQALGGKSILRVYRARWRSLSDIGYELDALTHLDRRGVPVAAPIARKDGGFLRQLSAPEGSRPAVLFRYANGREPSQDQYYLYGRAAAAIHAATDDFVSRHARFQLDLRHLVDQPLAAIQPFLAHRPDDWAYLEGLANRVRQRIERLPIGQLEWGFCHGDLHGGNAHIDEHQTITFFDFDCGGLGWRAYDIAAFRQGPWGRQEQAWEAFLKGYTERRSLNELDLAAVPWFVALRHIWLMGLHTSNSHDWGCAWLNDDYFDGGGVGGLQFLREWEETYLSGKEETR